MFHPLITPLTTYMYTTDIQDNGTVSATDDERLPPGGFSLRHGFPEWFGRGRKSAAGARRDGSRDGSTSAAATPQPTGAAKMITPESATAGAKLSYARSGSGHTSAYDILKYIKKAFSDEDVLDAVPLDAAGNPGAWHAWRTHRRRLGKLTDEKELPPLPRPHEEGGEAPAEAVAVQGKKDPAQATPRRPGEWNWDGVWEDRVKKGISSSLSEPVLYGGTSALPDDLVCHAFCLVEGSVANRV